METDGAYVNAESGEDTFHAMRDLLSNRRALLGKLGQSPGNNRPRENMQVATGEDVQSVLGILQQKANHAVLVDGKPTPRSVTHVKRSEEHTSELQSLMRISYAVFCLKKKKKTIT